MNTLTTPPVAPLLERLFAEAAASNAVLGKLFGHLSREERTRRMGDPHADYRAFFTQMEGVHLAVSPVVGSLLYLLARANGARGIVEYGTSFGISTLHLAAALRDNGGGRLVGSELLPTKVASAQRSLEAAGLADLVEIRAGDGLETLARDLPDVVDVLLLDGHKPLYEKILGLVAPRLRSGSCIVADNADACPGYTALVRARDSGYFSLPFRDDVELTLKL
jgi:predicted O-methyltransferase YrrM